VTTPVPATAILGRGDEITAGCRLLTEHRLVTVVGPGGVGKTRLAIELANEFETETERLVFVELADLEIDPDPEIATGPDEVTRLLRDRLGMSATGDRADNDVGDSADGWRRLDTDSILLILDNCEHVIDQVAPLVGELLATTTRTTVLATSRQPMAVAGEQVLDLPPLAIKAPKADSGKHAGAEVIDGAQPGGGSTAGLPPALELFRQRAHAVNRNVEIDDSALELVTELCRLLDGLPLAIEMAAAQLAWLPLTALVDRIRRSPDLRHDRRDTSGRHRSLDANVEWSRRLLADDRRAALDLLSVFSTGFTLEAATAVMAGTVDDPARALADLVAHSLVMFDAGAGRYQVLNHVRMVSRRHLSDEQRNRAQRRRARWCARLTTEHGTGAREPETVRPILLAETDNLQAAAQWCQETGDDTLFVEVVGPVAITWIHLGWPAEPDRWLAAANGADSVPDPSVLNVMLAVGFLLGWRNRLTEAAEVLERVAEAAELADAGEQQANALVQLGHIRAVMAAGSEAETGTEEDNEGDVDADSRAEVEPTYQHAIRLYDGLGGPWGRAWGRFYLARWLEPIDLERSRAILADSADIIAGLDYPVLEGLILERLARQRLAAGEPQAAAELARRSIRLHAVADYPEGEATSANVLGLVLIELGRLGPAATKLRHSLRLALAIGHRGIVDESLLGLAALAVANRHRRLAARLLGVALGRAGAEIEAVFLADRLPSDGDLAELLEDSRLVDDLRLGHRTHPVDVLDWDLGVGSGTGLDQDRLVEPLSDRELSVLRWLRSDLTQRRIADELIVAPSTVKSHVKAIYRKLGVSSRAEAVERARQVGLV
jgi:predicted ATPase/DNA-binding CsgD family transcriptional regulator